jgi:hypothetical protein
MTSWSEYAEWTLETAKKHLEILSEVEKNIGLRLTQSYVSIIVNGRKSYMYDKRIKPNSVVWFNIKEEEKADAVRKLLDVNNNVYSYSKYKDFNFTYDKQFLTKN